VTFPNAGAPERATTEAAGSDSGYGLGVAHHTPAREQICISTERLCLRMPTLEDAEAMHGLFADRVVMHGLNREPVFELDETRAVIEGGMDGWRTDGLGPFILETAADRVMVGQAGLMIFDTRGWTPSTWTRAGSHAQPELGWALLRVHWGFGYATEAAAAIRDWGYESRSIALLVSLISPGNVRSQRVAERLGATPTGTVTPAHTKQSAVVWRHTSAPLAV
jgi:RimJ/RimL family protein N-acetyltransferase